MQEKRNFTRFDRNVSIKLQIIESSAEYEVAPHYLLTKNICAGGIFIDTEKPMPKGTDVILEIALPSNNSINETDLKNHCFVKVRGTVVRTETTGIALCFKKDFQIEFGNMPEYISSNIHSEDYSTNN